MFSFVPKEETVDPAYQPGTFEYLRRVAKEKLEKKAEDASASPAVDKSLLISEDTTSPKEPTSPKEGHIDGGLIRIINNYCFFDRDIFKLFFSLKEAEMRIYLDLYMRSYAKKTPRNICSCTNSQLSDTTGITSSSAFSRAFKGLESKRLIKRLLISRSSNEKSLFRVFLPCELSGSKSTTQITYVTDDDLP
jgi:hypothetical protein